MYSKLVILDASNVLFRYYFALKETQKLPAIFGLVKTIYRLLERNPSHMVVAFDTKGPTWRHELCNTYKSDRPTTPSDLIEQIRMAYDVCKAFGIYGIGYDKYEADDVIGSFATQCKDCFESVEIVSSDKDLMQLVGGSAYMYDPFKRIMMAKKHVFQKMGVAPDQIVDLLALAGDPSDCVPGVPRVGLKTAAQWLNQYGTLENIYAHCDQLKPSSRAKSLSENYSLALLSKKLVKISTDLELPDPSVFVTQFDTETVAKFLIKHELSL